MKSPIIYLDHWAVAKIASNDNWRDRFIEALHKKNGTLLFSSLNIIEVGRHINAQPYVKMLLDGVGTSWCFIDVNAPAVIEREEKWVSGQMSPCFNETGLRSYYPYIHDEPLTLSKIIELVTGQKDHYDNIYSRLDENVDQMTDIQEAIRRKDPKIDQHAYKLGGYNPQQPTKYVYYSLMRSTLWSTLKLNRNHIADLQHATAALAYADFILLDGHWHQQSLDLLKELPNLRNRIFKDSPSEMERFLQTFENVQLS